MIERHIVPNHVHIAHIMQAVAEIHIVESHPQILVPSAAFFKKASFHHQTGARHAQHIEGKSVSEKIIIRPIVPVLQLMGRAQPDVGDARMLDGAAGRVEKLHANRSNMGKLGLFHHFFQPVLLNDLYIVV